MTLPNPNDLVTVNVSNCENMYDIQLPNGELVDCSEITDQFSELIKDSGIRMMMRDEPIMALIDRDGNVYGGIFGQYEYPEDMEEYEEDGASLTFSIVIDSRLRGNKLAERMIKDLLKHHRSKFFWAKVVNPVMVKILTNLGFSQITNEKYSERDMVFQKYNG